MLDAEEEIWDNFCNNADQYSLLELPVTITVHRILKCFRGHADGIPPRDGEQGGGCTWNQQQSAAAYHPGVDRAAAPLDNVVGEGITELGCVLYPPLNYPELAK